MDVDEYQRMAAAGETHWWYRATRRLLEELTADHLPPVTEHTVYLDAGGGSGATGSWLAARATTALDDYEATALAVATERFEGFRPVRCDINRIPHPDAAFDASLCVTALCHRLNPDPQVVVDELARVTKSGGIVCLMEPGVRRLRRGHDEVTQTARRFSVGDMRAMLTAAGLDVVTATGAYSFLIPPAAILGLVERGEPQSDVGRHSSGLGGLLGTAARVERRLLRRTSLPFGLSVIGVGRKR